MRNANDADGDVGKGSENKRFLVISLIMAIITNLIFRGPITYAYHELSRLINKGFHGNVFWFFLEEFSWWLLITGGVFFGTFAILKGVSAQARQDKADYEKAVKDSEEIAKGFSQTKNIGDLVSFDNDKRKWAIHSKYGLIDQIYCYSDIINFELLEDGNSVASGGIGRALVGGALFGGVGAIVGGVTGKKKSKKTCLSLSVKITINNIEHPVVYIHLIEKETKTNSNVYEVAHKQAQEIVSTLQLICEQEGSEDETKSNAPSEIMQYKQLLDEGAITEEEFKQKKKELLNL